MTRERSGIQSVHRALDLLERIGSRGEAGVSELARDMDLPVTTVHSLLRTLAQRHYAISSGGRYRLGPAVTVLTSHWDPVLSLAPTAAAVLERLASRTGLAATGTVLMGREARNLGFAQGPADVTTGNPSRWTAPLSLATGRLLVSFLPESQWPSFIADGHGTEPGWSAPRWTRELRLTRDRRYGVRRGRDPRESAALGVPVTGADGTVVAAIGCSVPSFLAADLFTQEQFDHLWAGAQELASELGAADHVPVPTLDPALATFGSSPIGSPRAGPAARSRRPAGGPLK